MDEIEDHGLHLASNADVNVLQKPMLETTAFHFLLIALLLGLQLLGVPRIPPAEHFFCRWGGVCTHGRTLHLRGGFGTPQVTIKMGSKSSFGSFGIPA